MTIYNQLSQDIPSPQNNSLLTLKQVVEHLNLITRTNTLTCQQKCNSPNTFGSLKNNYTITRQTIAQTTYLTVANLDTNQTVNFQVLPKLAFENIVPKLKF
jgi:hypothetical protein